MPELVLYGIRLLAKQLLGSILDMEVDQSDLHWSLVIRGRLTSCSTGATSVPPSRVTPQPATVRGLFTLIPAVGNRSNLLHISPLLSSLLVIENSSHILTDKFIKELRESNS